MDDSDMGEVCAYRAYMSYASLRNVNCHNADFVCADLRNTRLCCSNLSGAIVRYADLRGTDFTGCSLESADLTAAITDSNTCFNKVTFNQYTIFPENVTPPPSACFVIATEQPEWIG